MKHFTAKLSSKSSAPSSPGTAESSDLFKVQKVSANINNNLFIECVSLHFYFFTKLIIIAHYYSSNILRAVSERFVDVKLQQNSVSQEPTTDE